MTLRVGERAIKVQIMPSQIPCIITGLSFAAGASISVNPEQSKAWMQICQEIVEYLVKTGKLQLTEPGEVNGEKQDVR